MVADFAKAMGKFAKTDVIDATVLAEFGSRMRPELTTPAPEELRMLEAVMSRRAQILEMITMETNRLGSTRDANARASLETVIKILKEQVSDMDSQMLKIVRSNLELKTLDELLRSVPGVGAVVSATMPAGAFYGQEVVRTEECDTFGLVGLMCGVCCTWGFFRQYVITQCYE